MNQITSLIEWVFMSWPNFGKFIFFLFIIWCWLVTMLTLVVESFMLKIKHDLVAYKGELKK